MGAEHDVRLRNPALEFHVVVELLVGVDDVELRHVATAHGIETGVIRNFLKSRGKRPGVATQFGATRIRHVFARTRNRKTRKPAEDIADCAPDNDQNQSEDDDDSTTSPATPTAGTRARTAEHCRKELDGNRLNCGENTHEHDAHDHESRIAILDVREFVTHNSSEFGIVQFLNKTCGKRNRKRGNVDAACKGVQAIILNDVDLRHLNAACDAEVFDNVVDAQVILAFQRFCVRGMPNDRGVRAVGDDEPHAHNLERVRQHRLESFPHFGPMHGSVLHVGGMVCRAAPFDNTAKPPEIVQRHDRRKNHSQDNNREHTQQQNTVAVVPPNLGLDTYVFH